MSELFDKKKVQDKILGPLLASKKISIDPRKDPQWTQNESEAITLLAQNLHCMSSQKKAEFLCIVGNSFFGAYLMRSWLKGEKDLSRNPTASTETKASSPVGPGQQLRSNGKVEINVRYNDNCGGSITCRETLVFKADLLDHVKPHKGWDAEQKKYLEDFLNTYRSGRIKNDEDINYWFNSYSEQVARLGNVNPVRTPRPFRKDKDTSLFPNGVEAEDVILSMSKNGGTRKQLGGSDVSEVVRVEHKGDFYDVVVCKSTCIRKNPDAIMRENEVLTIYPYCGKNIKRVVSLKKAKKIAAQKDPLLSEESFIESVPCE